MDDQQLQDALRATTRFARLEHHHECDSTQDLAVRDELAGDSVHWADHQTRGRGRSDHVWQDEPGLDLAVTFRVRGLVPAAPLALPMAVPLAAARTVEPLVGNPVRIKWPNDVLVGGRKVCGVLIDGLGGASPTWLLGIGINVNRVRFPPELEHLATSLALESGNMVDRHALLLALAQNLDVALALAAGPRAAELLPSYRIGTGLMGRIVQVQTHAERVRGALVDVDFEHLTLDTGRRIALGSVVSLREADSD